MDTASRSGAASIGRLELAADDLGKTHPGDYGVLTLIFVFGRLRRS